MRITGNLNLRPHLFPLILSIVVGLVVLFMRYWTLPHSFLYLFWHVLIGTTVLKRYLINPFMIDSISDIRFSLLITIITGFFIVSLVKSWSCFVKARKKTTSAILPLWINIITIFVVIYGNYPSIFRDFYSNFKPMQEVVQMVESGQLTFSSIYEIYDHDSIDIVDLPTKYKNLSIADIRGETTGTFYVVRGLDKQINLIAFIRTAGTDPIGQRYTAFMYKPRGKSISPEEIWGINVTTPSLEIIEVKKITTPSLNPDKANWFWVDVYED
ncbi:MAG: hypothetical protein F6K47_09255 [Symploca sp. SIO2E6]|nr:hypothetical protein [Symploca sp. SIO2E6]